MLARCIPWKRQYCSALYQLACAEFKEQSFLCFFFIYFSKRLFIPDLEEDSEVVLLSAQSVQRHGPPVGGGSAAVADAVRAT